MTRICLFAALAALAAGCGPVPEKEDEVQKTLRMIEEAKAGPGGAAGVSGGAGRNVYVKVERLRVAVADAAGLGGLWRHASGRVTVSGADGLGAGGVRLGLAGADFEAEVSAWARKSRHASRTAEEILVSPGAEGLLYVGREVLVPVLRVRSASGAVEVLERRRLGAALRVVPHLLDDGRIELELSPQFSELEAAPGGGRTIAVTAMTTRVVLRPGERLVLGASSSVEEGSAAGALFGFDSRGGRTSTLVTVKAERL